MSDFQVIDEGSVVLFNAMTSEARQWAIECFPLDCSMWCGAYAVEANYVDAIFETLHAEGFDVELI